MNAVELTDLMNIKIHFFHPSITSILQPCDAGIIKTCKAHYQASFLQLAVSQYYESNLNSTQELYNINQLEAMLMMQESWDSVSQETIANCWKHTKIYSELTNSTN
ncbi:hypothetical protein O181_034028 [Austropuccinia psidii MF-1]|uniref:DDE-1 domain-containing protein n=1 Tax=Austropuccinia psidii MF-1 TaxID=1389203 RepID=A0A9Q3D2N0_9BASI|nr:hypothetical protein [Austropuccinia psidii MF-1]